MVTTTRTEDTELRQLVDRLVERHGSDASALIPVLQGVRAQRHDIDQAAMEVVADRLGLTPVTVEGVATFYEFLGTGATGSHTIRLCRTLPCMLGGARRVGEVLLAHTGGEFGATTDDLTLQWTACMGLCDQTPAMLVDGEAYGKVTPTQAVEIVEALRAGDSAQEG